VDTLALAQHIRECALYYAHSRTSPVEHRADPAPEGAPRASVVVMLRQHMLKPFDVVCNSDNSAPA